MNKFKVTINTIDYTSHAIYPLKWGELLDERLDEAYFTLKFIDKVEPFQPLDKVSISINDGTKIVNYYVANDKVDNNPVGSNLYTHTLYVIEETKFLEAFICDTLTFRNALLNRFGETYEAVPVGNDKFDDAVQRGVWHLGFVLKNPVEVLSRQNFPSITDIYTLDTSDKSNYETFQNQSSITVTVDGVEKIKILATDTGGLKTGAMVTFGVTTEVEYVVQTAYYNTDDGTYNAFKTIKVTYTLNGVENRLPLKKWTITDVVNRCLELAEPLREGENPRFNFDGVSYKNGEIQKYTIGSQAEKYDKIIAPEFSMTKNTLREQLKQIGGFIHAEPRLSGNTVLFVEWGGNEQSKISEKQFISQSQTHSIDEYCTELDSTANNLVNRLNYAQGVIMEPSRSGSRSLRTEQINIRIEETNGIIETVLPIADLVKLEVSAPTNETGTEYSNFVDITSYTYEQGDYSNLSSYDVNVKGSKAYALYWARNQKNIKGLFFKNENALNPIFSKYAIVNILVACAVNMNTGTDNSNSGNSNYPRLRFRVSYIPIYTARVRTNKSLVVDTLPRTLVYNQGANSVETQYYGENLKGVAARLGNIEKTFTYKLTSLSDIPKAGELFDDHYYISAVSCELYPDYIKCTIGLSKDFNRLSEYIGISSEYRQYQVSETAVYNRETVLQEYALITGNTEKTTDSNLWLSNSAIETIKSLFNLSDDYNDIISTVSLQTRNKSGTALTSYSISLPVISSSFGNTISFRFAFDDNYSAGQKSAIITKDNKTQYYSEYVPYTNYYGKFYWLEFKFLTELKDDNTNPFNLPEAPIEQGDELYDYTRVSGKIRYRKDNAEIPSVNYQLSFVTDDPKYIIGSAIAGNCLLCSTKIPEASLHVYGFTERLPLFADKLDIENGLKNGSIIDLNEIELLPDEGVISFKLKTTTQAIKAWAIVTQSDETTQEVEDESGNKINQTVQNGHRLVIGCNQDYAAGQTITFPRIVFKHKIYK